MDVPASAALSARSSASDSMERYRCCATSHWARRADAIKTPRSDGFQSKTDIMVSNNGCDWSDFDYSNTYVVNKTHYFYQPCVTLIGSSERYNLVKDCLTCNRSEALRCSQFCDKFESVLPPIYGSISGLSALCCLGVFLTYFALPRLRRSGYSSKVFLYR